MTNLMRIIQPVKPPSPIAKVRGKDITSLTSSAAKVSIIIPCYNYARYLPSSVRSALDQIDVDVEVIIVDDASTDGSIDTAEAMARVDSRVRVLRHFVNEGPVSTFNDGLADATGEYIVRLDADDVLTPGSIARAVNLAEVFPNVGLVYGHPIHFEGDEQPTRFRQNVRSWTIWNGSDWLDYRCLLGVNCITSPEVLMRASVVRQVGGQRNLAHTHDMEMWLRIARASDVGWIAGSDQAWHREHAASLSATKVDLMTDLAERADAFRLLLTDGEGLVAKDFWRLRAALSALANEATGRACQAYAKGRGDSAEVRAYLDFANGLCNDLLQLPHGPTLEKSISYGARRARYSLTLLGRAVAYRLGSDWRRIRWKTTGL